MYSSLSVVAQKKNVSLDEVWSKFAFSQKQVRSINWMKDGSFYSALENGRIVKHQVTDGAAVETLFDEGVSVENLGQKITIADYTLSSNEQKILIETDPEQIYRRSSRAENFVYDIKSKN
jgi:dipeptidyl-peptidase-4